jgi:hypothetical protein
LLAVDLHQDDRRGTRSGAQIIQFGQPQASSLSDKLKHIITTRNANVTVTGHALHSAHKGCVGIKIFIPTKLSGAEGHRL